MPRKKKDPASESLEFEIQFYEGVLRQRPEFVEALMALGDIYTKQGRIEDGLAVDKKLESLRPDNPIVLYNLACSYSLLNRIDPALDAIRRAVVNGYGDFDFMMADGDLANLRRDERFQTFIRQWYHHADNKPDQ